MKDKIPKSQKQQRDEEKATRGRFIPCERETGGGAQVPGNGTTCVGGQMFFWARYQGKMERYTKDCVCLVAWRNGEELALPGRPPQAALSSGDAKAKAAGE